MIKQFYLTHWKVVKLPNKYILPINAIYFRYPNDTFIFLPQKIKTFSLSHIVIYSHKDFYIGKIYPVWLIKQKLLYFIHKFLISH